MDRTLKLAIKGQNNKRYYRHIHYPEIPLTRGDIYVITSEGDRLDLLANQYYKDTSLWWIITCANPGVVSRDSFYIKPGTQIRIPNSIMDIKKKYEELNF